MGSSEVMRNLELLSMQYAAQREWGEQSTRSAMNGVAHFSKLAKSYRSDCAEAMQARACALSFERAAMIFAEVVVDCSRVLGEIEQEMAV